MYLDILVGTPIHASDATKEVDPIPAWKQYVQCKSVEEVWRISILQLTTVTLVFYLRCWQILVWVPV